MGLDGLDQLRSIPAFTGVQPIGRMGEAWEVAKLVVYLCSEDAGYITGSTFVIDGGANLTSRFNNNY